MEEDDFDTELFATMRVKELQNEDFLLSSVERIVLKATGCSIILFYVLNDPVSKGCRNLWNVLANNFASVQFMAVNASRRVNIMQAFEQVKNDLDHPLNEYRLRGFPSILVYREGGEDGVSWPKAFYNGELSSEALQDWILRLACEPGYIEKPALREGVVSDLNVVVSDPRIMNDNRPASSLDFQDREFELTIFMDDEEYQQEQQFEREIYEEELDTDLLEEYNEIRPLPNDLVRGYGGYQGNDPGWLDVLVDSSFTLDN